MDSPETWRWIWLAAAAMFVIGEMATPGSFFLLPFGVGGAAAAIAGFAGADLTVQWGVFTAVSVIAFLALRPLAKRLGRDIDDTGIGAKRLVGAVATVIDAVDAHSGRIRVEAEEWRAVSHDGSVIAAGAKVIISEVRGTRAVVQAQDQ